MLLVMALMATHCMHMLVKASQHLCVLTGCSNLDYGEVGSATLEVRTASSPLLLMVGF
jgi:hypothetical protein